MSELSSKAKKLFDEFNYSQTVYHAFLASGINNEYIEKKRKTRDAKRESFEEYVVGLESRIAELETARCALKAHIEELEEVQESEATSCKFCGSNKSDIRMNSIVCTSCGRKIGNIAPPEVQE